MVKVMYPDSGTLASVTRNSINDCVYRLGNAQGFCYFYLPPKCPNADYLKSLNYRIGLLKTKTSNLLKSIEKIDASYAMTKDQLNAVTRKLSKHVIDDRHRHIY